MTDTERGPGYWYPAADKTRRGVEVLTALRQYRSAEAAMRRRTRSSMGMGETDLIAVQFLIRRRREGRIVNAKDLAAYLEISSASTTVLVDRLVRSGHVRREPHPTDRRGVVIVPTTTTDSEVRATLSGMHARMIAISETLSIEEARVIVSFLDRMGAAVDVEDQEHTTEHTDRHTTEHTTEPAQADTTPAEVVTTSAAAS